MKNIILLLFFALPIFSIAQSQYEVTPKKYRIDDANFEDKIDPKDAFGDDDSSHSTHSNSLRHLGEHKKTLATSFTLGLRPPALSHTKSVSVSV